MLRLPPVPCAALVLCLLAAPAARAQEQEAAPHFDYTGFQLLHGGGFDDVVYGYTPRDGRMTALTLENFTEWAWGDSYFFFDLMNGDFGDAPTDKFRIYGEWNPRLSFSKLLGTRVGFLFVEDVLLAGELNRGGSGFNALLLGPAVNLRVPGISVLQVHAYLRQDNFSPLTWQLTGVWFAPFALGPVRLSLGGFVDVLGLPGGGLDVLTQPQLLWDAGVLLGAAPERVKVGLEWYLHRSALGFTSAPQAMLRLAY